MRYSPVSGGSANSGLEGRGGLREQDDGTIDGLDHSGLLEILERMVHRLPREIGDARKLFLSDADERGSGMRVPEIEKTKTPRQRIGFANGLRKEGTFTPFFAGNADCIQCDTIE